MAHFYKKLLEETEQKHEETVAATAQKPSIGPQGSAPNLTIVKPPDFTPKNDIELARVAREQGKDVELNDDNQIVDKRELLSAGLNLSAPNTRQVGLQKKKSESEESVQSYRAVGTAASRKEINERRAREVTKQMEEERERMLKEKEREEQESINRIVAKRNTEDSISSAKERYLARKRRKLEEAAANPEAD
jgi:coiled-coil domain-containing protein 55